MSHQTPSALPGQHDHHSHAGLHLRGHHGAFALGVVLNLGFVLVEVAWGLMAHSLALLSDAGHNLSDVFALLLAWAAAQASRRAPSKRRTYGLRRASILAALANAVLLLIAVGIIAWEALRRLMTPQPVVGATVIWVALLGTLVNGFTAWLFMRDRAHDLNRRGVFVHMTADAAVSLAVALAGIAMLLTHWLWLDALASLLVSGVIVWGAWGLLRESFNLALDTVPAHINPHEVEHYLASLPGVQALHDLHIWGMSTTETALTVHLVMPTPPEQDTFLHDLSAALNQHFHISHATIQIERGNSPTPCLQAPEHVV